MSATSPAVGSSAVARATVPGIQAVYWSVRRELWENRSLYLAPMAAAAVFLFGFMVSLITLPDRMRAAFALEAAKRHSAILEPYMFGAFVIMATGVIVAIIYSLDALYGERRDRSILFWKSLPVSDWMTVLVKAGIPLAFLPLLTTALTVIVHLSMLLMSSVAIWVGGLTMAPLWQEVAPVRMGLVLLYHMMTIHMLWYAPVFAWLLLASAWARRAPFLWAAIPLLAVGVIERVAFGTSHSVALLEYRLSGGPEAHLGASDLPIDPWIHITPGAFLTSPHLWAGFALAAVFLAAAVWLRRQRVPI